GEVSCSRPFSCWAFRVVWVQGPLVQGPSALCVVVGWWWCAVLWVAGCCGGRPLGWPVGSPARGRPWWPRPVGRVGGVREWGGALPCGVAGRRAGGGYSVIRVVVVWVDAGAGGVGGDVVGSRCGAAGSIRGVRRGRCGPPSRSGARCGDARGRPATNWADSWDHHQPNAPNDARHTSQVRL